MFDIDKAINNIREYAELLDKYRALEEENKKLKWLLKEHVTSYDVHFDELIEENKRLKERIDILYEFIERNDKLVDEVIDEEDLDKLNRYIYIDDDLVDRTLESED